MSFYSELIIYRDCVFRRHNARQADFKTTLKRLENVPLGPHIGAHIYMSRWHPCLQQPWGDTKEGIVKSLRSLGVVVLPRWKLKINSKSQKHSRLFTSHLPSFPTAWWGFPRLHFTKQCAGFYIWFFTLKRWMVILIDYSLKMSFW